MNDADTGVGAWPKSQKEALRPILESAPPAGDAPGSSIEKPADGRIRQRAVRDGEPGLPASAISVLPGLP